MLGQHRSQPYKEAGLLMSSCLALLFCICGHGQRLQPDFTAKGCHAAAPETLRGWVSVSDAASAPAAAAAAAGDLAG
jgi:hypothetical protein